ncbi:MAG: hypothetical protein MJE77_07900 [Proteobacteria bacterium]|nr:hypothetical protein [Pseudomonadota bacterium]
MDRDSTRASSGLVPARALATAPVRPGGDSGTGLRQLDGDGRLDIVASQLLYPILSFGSKK